MRLEESPDRRAHAPCRRRWSGGVARLGLITLLAGHGVSAQELEPRAYSPNPVGTSFLIAGYGYQSGDILFDPALPLTDVAAYLNSAVLGYGRTYGLFGRMASVGVAVPYVWGSINGKVYEERRRATRSGLADLRVKLSVNVLGGPALKPREFAARKPGTTLGASLTVNAPTGQYGSEKLINLGTNRWAFKPEVGLSYPAGRFTLELYAGAWLFLDNRDFFGGSVLEQDPLASVQAHLAYTLRPRMWLAVDGTYYAGGRTYTNGVAASERQDNARVGLTLALPLGQRHSIKLAWAKGVSTRVGEKVQIYSIAYQFLWFDRQ